MDPMRALVLLVASGCSFSAPIGGATPTDDAGGDALPADARPRPPEGPCGKAGAIEDDFADGAIAPTWIVANRADTAEGGGTLAVTPSAAAFSGYLASPYVDLRDAAAEVEVRTMVTAGTGAVAMFMFTHRDGGRFGISVADGMMTMGAGGDTATIPYDPVAHRHWRVAGVGDEVVFSTSPDGLDWTAHHTANAPPFVDGLAIGLGAVNPQAAPAPGTVTFAQFNTTVAPAAWCAAATLSDDFNDATIGRAWAYHGHTSAGCLEYENTVGNARVDQNGSAACDAFYGASALYDLTASAMVVRISAITTFTTGWITYAGVWDVDRQRFARMYFEQNQMCADGTGITKTCVAYSTQRDLWRIREEGGTLYFETANSTANTYTAVHAVPAPFPLDAVRPFFGTLTDRATNQSIGLNVDRFN